MNILLLSILALVIFIIMSKSNVNQEGFTASNQLSNDIKTTFKNEVAKLKYSDYTNSLNILQALTQSQEQTTIANRLPEFRRLVKQMLITNNADFTTQDINSMKPIDELYWNLRINLKQNDKERYAVGYIYLFVLYKIKKLNNVELTDDTLSQLLNYVSKEWKNEW
jgi:hypothetical protein